MRTVQLVVVAAAMLLLVTPAVAGEEDAQATEPPLGPPVVYEDPAGDTAEGAPDLISCGVSEPFDSLLRFDLEFADAPPLSYDMETMTTDELWVAVASTPEAMMPDDIEYALIVHGATLAEAADSGSGLYDATAAEGDEVFWGVVDVAVDEANLALSVDRKLLGDPDELRFFAWAGGEGEGEAYDSCPDEEAGAGEYVLYRE